jgi:exodeoxyribonuclease X
MTVRVIDCETTGTDAAVDAVIEIASVDVLADGTITNRQEALICPPIPVPSEASAVHHLLYQDLTGKPALRDVLPMFQGAQAYVAHKAEFEQAFLGEHLGEALWVCTWKCALRIWPDAKSHSNQALRYRLGLENPFWIDRAALVPHGRCRTPS